MRRRAVKEVGVMCTAGAIIALKWRGKMLLDGIIGKGARSEPLPGKAYIEFHSGSKVIKMKYIETCYSTHKLRKASGFYTLFYFPLFNLHSFVM